MEFFPPEPHGCRRTGQWLKGASQTPSGNTLACLPNTKITSEQSPGGRSSLAKGFTILFISEDFRPPQVFQGSERAAGPGLCPRSWSTTVASLPSSPQATARPGMELDHLSSKTSRAVSIQAWLLPTGLAALNTDHLILA